MAKLDRLSGTLKLTDRELSSLAAVVRGGIEFRTLHDLGLEELALVLRPVREETHPADRRAFTQTAMLQRTSW